MRRHRNTPKRAENTNRSLPSTLLAASAAAFMVSNSTSPLLRAAPVLTQDPHQTGVANDSDADLLSDREETALGYDPFRADQNRTGVFDGAELAMRCAAVMNDLPPHIEQWKAETYGLEHCDVCGQAVNMGMLGIINHRLGVEVAMPFIAFHYLEHGAFDFAGDIHKGRFDVARLAWALEVRFPCAPDDHYLPLDLIVEPIGSIAPDANDLDMDHLADSEELAVGLDPRDADQDANLEPDGDQLARRCAELIEALPIVDSNQPTDDRIYRISYMMRGLEWCPICGESVNMGYWQIVNGPSRESIDVPEISLHFMQHGSFSYLGDVHVGGRVAIETLLKILEVPSACGDLGIPYSPADVNRDCNVDMNDFTEFAQRWLEAVDPESL